MLIALKIPKLVDPSVSDLKLKWGGDLQCVLDYGVITDEEVQALVKGTFRCVSKEVVYNQICILDFA